MSDDQRRVHGGVHVVEYPIVAEHPSGCQHGEDSYC